MRPLVLVALAAGLCAAAPVKVDPKLQAELTASGYAIGPDRTITRLKDRAAIDQALLAQAGYVFDEQGRLILLQGHVPVPLPRVPAIVDSLAEFGRIKALDARQAAEALRQWGVPTVVEGRHLLNPDGTPTYFGFALYNDLKDRRGAGSRIDRARIAQALLLYHDAFDKTFRAGMPDEGMADLFKARFAANSQLDPRARPRAPSAASPVASLSAPTAAASRAGPAEQRRLAAELSRLERLRFHPELNLGNVPLPAGVSEAAPPSHVVLPRLLALADKLNGKPLTDAQRRWLIEAMPLGDVLLRLGAPALWRQGLTGQGVNVAVVDTGIVRDPDFAGRVASARDFINEGKIAEHGTAVAYAITAVAPDAQLRSYRAMDEKGESRGTSVAQAIDAAAAGGNQIINLSLAGPDYPEMRAAVARARDKGILVVAASGNDPKAHGVEAPALDPGALAVGGLDDDGHAWSGMSRGSKRQLLAPARVKTLVVRSDGTREYDNRTGTSMSSGLVSGSSALLWQEASRGTVQLVSRAAATLADRVEASLWARTGPPQDLVDGRVLDLAKNPIDNR